MGLPPRDFEYFSVVLYMILNAVLYLMNFELVQHANMLP